jgi:hypothetical protein
VGTRPILGVSTLRTTFLDDLPATQPRQTQAHNGAGFVTNSDNTCEARLTLYRLDDDIDEDVDDEDDEDDDIAKETDGDDDEEEEDEDDDEDEETWQVSDSAPSR